MNAPRSAGALPLQLSEDLAAASRILVAQSVVDGFGHVSMRHPSAPDRYLMSRSIAPALVTPADIIEYDARQRSLQRQRRDSFLERFIHGEIYKARPDIMSVVHSHSPSVIPFGLVAMPMQAMFHNAAFIAAGVPVFDIREQVRRHRHADRQRAQGRGARRGDGPQGHRPHARRTGAWHAGRRCSRRCSEPCTPKSMPAFSTGAAALGGGAPIAALDAEEGRLADQVNQTAGMRAWNLWRSQVSGRGTQTETGNLKLSGFRLSFICSERLMSEAESRQQLVDCVLMLERSRHHRLQRPLQRPRRRQPHPDQHRVVSAKPAHRRMTSARSTSRAG